MIAHTLRAGALRSERSLPDGAVALLVNGATLALDVKDLIDIPAERARLAKDIAAHAANAAATAKKLDNADFVARAPEEVVEENRARLAEAEAAKTRLMGVLARLEALG